ncbi:ABC transporter substrate binding protein [[Clostridium] aminophilum]|uniref:ABC transporter substrate binding protein n=1 Tax=[Clostridium] aminophilum TaxID=1526 RepID=UPI003F9D5B4F
MKRFKTAAALMTAGAMVLSMAACGSSSKPAETAQTTTAAAASSAAETGKAEATEAKKEDGAKFKIGVLQLVQHPALDKANEGFVKALDDAGLSYEIDQQNASGDQSACQTIASGLVANQNDLILAIATPAAQAVAGQTSDIPVLVTAVTDPEDAGLVKDNKKPGTNVSGTSDLTPVKEQIGLLRRVLPEAKTVGVMYSSAESNSVLQAALAKEACEANGLTYLDVTVSNSNEISDVVNSLVGKVDAIYCPTDNMIAAGMATVSMVANENRIPVICGEEGMVDAGGLATYGIDYYQLGYMTGKQAVEILRDGKNVSEMPIGYLDQEKCALKVNEETAKSLGLDPAAVK